jgi:hypothetical protein
MCLMLRIQFVLKEFFFGGGGLQDTGLCCVDDVYRGLKYCALLAEVKKKCYPNLYIDVCMIV